MAAAGVFKLIANDGKADRMIMATKLLNQRIKDIMCMRTKSGFDDPTPTLVDIEKTHILFVNAHFKPFAALGYEYNKVQNTSGSPRFANSVTFSIPQFGDFFHDMVVHTVLGEASTTAGTSPNANSLPTLANVGATPALRSSTTVNAGEAVGLPLSISNLVVVDASPIVATRAAAVASGASSYELKIVTRSYVDCAGTAIVAATPVFNFVKYCNLPGLRLFEKVKFDVNGNPLDEYETMTYLYHDKFNVQPNKRVGWNRLIGQEVPINAIAESVSIDNVECMCSGALDINGALVGAPTGNDTARQQTQVLNGPQTAKLVQPSLEMWIPLLFWFNMDPRLSIASVSIPYGLRMIEITLAAREKMLYLAPGNLFLQTKTECYTMTVVGPAPVAPFPNYGALGDTSVSQSLDTIADYSVTIHREGVVVSDSLLSESNSRDVNLTLYINNIFVNPEIHDIYIKRIGFSLIRVHRHQRETVSSPQEDKLLSNLKWPVETMYVAARPTYNQKKDNPNQPRDWALFTRLHNEHVYEKCCDRHLSAPLLSEDTTLTANSQAALLVGGYVLDNVVSLNKDFVYPVSELTIDRVRVAAHGIPIYNDFPAAFFSDYSPYIWGGRNLATPDDQGALMVNFCLYPNTYQPSGHLNISRAREFFFQYTSSYIGRSDSNNGPDDYASASGESVRDAELLVLAIAINFLLISDGSAVLRYST
jgi:hypothetical protein